VLAVSNGLLIVAAISNSALSIGELKLPALLRQPILLEQSIRFSLNLDEASDIAHDYLLPFSCNTDRPLCFIQAASLE